MKNLIIDLPENYSKLSSREINNSITSELKKRIQKEKLKLKHDIDREFTVKSYTSMFGQSTIGTGFFYPFAQCSYKKDGGMFNRIIYGIKVNDTIIIDPSLFTNVDIHDRDKSNNQFSLYYRTDRILVLSKNKVIPSIISASYPYEGFEGIVPISKKDLFRDYLSSVVFLYTKSILGINSNDTCMDIVMPVEYSGRINFIENYLKFKRMRDTPFRNNNSGNHLVYYLKKLSNG